MEQNEIAEFIKDMPDEVLSTLSFSMPWQYYPEEEGYKDADGFPVSSTSSQKDDSKWTIDVLQAECWKKFNQNPQVNTAVRGLIGRLVGWGFECTSIIQQIQEMIESIELDPRNRLYNFWPKYVGRSFVEGELFLLFTVHPNGFVEIDFIDPGTVKDGGDDSSGIIFHPEKRTFPLFYNITSTKNDQDILYRQIPSIFVARYPYLLDVAKKSQHFKSGLQGKSKSRKKIFKQFGGYNQFVVSWDRGFITRRAISYLRTTIRWLNHYENLKLYEIDHKKSSGAYLWAFSFEDPKAFRIWLGLSDEDKKKTAVMAKKTPGSSLVLPPGMKVEAVNPKLNSITDQDTDIMQMATSGLNEPADVTTGSAKGTFASVKASRGPMSDRTSDEIAYFDRYLKYDFWGSIFFLMNKVNGFPDSFQVREATSFNDQGEPQFTKVKKKPEQLVEVTYPISEVVNFEAKAKGLLGTKHGPIAETLGIAPSEISKMIGFGGYGRQRLRHATEKENYPELVYTLDAESLQEKAEGEPAKVKPRAKPKKEIK